MDAVCNLYFRQLLFILIHQSPWKKRRKKNSFILKSPGILTQKLSANPELERLNFLKSSRIQSGAPLIVPGSEQRGPKFLRLPYSSAGDNEDGNDDCNNDNVKNDDYDVMIIMIISGCTKVWIVCWLVLSTILYIYSATILLIIDLFFNNDTWLMIFFYGHFRSLTKSQKMLDWFLIFVGVCG